MHLKTLAFALFLLAPLTLPLAASDSATVTVEMDAETYSAQSTLLGAAPIATVLVLDEQGAPVAGTEVRVVFLRQVQFVGFVSNETVIGTTGADGTVSVAAPQRSCAPGTYLVAAFALGTAGSDRYTVGA